MYVAKLGETTEIALTVCGRERKLSEQELIAILEKHFPNEAKVIKAPTEGEWYDVDIQNINLEVFKLERRDKKQEEVRQMIWHLFDSGAANFYRIPFKTMVPDSSYAQERRNGCIYVARKLEYSMASMYMQILKWAQRICNEGWEVICNNPDTASYHRLVSDRITSDLVVYYLIGGTRLVDGPNADPPAYNTKIDQDWFRMQYKTVGETLTMRFVEEIEVPCMVPLLYQPVEVILPIHGRKKYLSKQELIDILEKHFQNELMSKKNQ